MKQWCIVWCDGMEMHVVQVTLFSLILSCSCHHFNIYCFRKLVKQWLLLVGAGKCRHTCPHRDVVETTTKCIKIASGMNVFMNILRTRAFVVHSGIQWAQFSRRTCPCIGIFESAWSLSCVFPIHF